MKKKLFAALLLAFVVLSLLTCAEEGIFILSDIGEYQRFATSHKLIPTPGYGGPVDYYENIGIMDKDGNVVVEPKYRTIDNFYEGRSYFLTNDTGLYGFFDENWNIVIEPKYKYVWRFFEGLASVADETGKFGYIDRDGNTVIPYIFDRAYSFNGGVARVGMVDEGYNLDTFVREGKIDKSGNIVEPIKYDREDEYDVQMSQNNINIMGTVYKNSELEYPFINYLGYTYMPLSFYTCFSLGFATTWNPIDGLGITPPGSVAIPAGNGVIFSNLLGENDMTEGEMFKAQLYRGTVTIAGETYTADDVYYPLLTYRDVVYIPVLWRQGMEGMGLDYTYDFETKSLVFKPKK